VNAWAFGTLVLITLIVVAGILLDRQADRGHEIRWHDRFYQPQLPVRRGRVIDVDGRPLRPHSDEDSVHPAPLQAMHWNR
jgi:hypothetical protein